MTDIKGVKVNDHRLSSKEF